MTEPNRTIRVLVWRLPSVNDLNLIINTRWDPPESRPLWCMPCQFFQPTSNFSPSQQTRKNKSRRCIQCEQAGR
jgi:hypothetical protein